MMITMMIKMISALIFVLSDDTLEKWPPSVPGLLITPTCLAKSIPSHDDDEDDDDDDDDEEDDHSTCLVKVIPFSLSLSL